MGKNKEHLFNKRMRLESELIKITSDLAKEKQKILTSSNNRLYREIECSDYNLQEIKDFIYLYRSFQENEPNKQLSGIIKSEFIHKQTKALDLMLQTDNRLGFFALLIDFWKNNKESISQNFNFRIVSGDYDWTTKGLISSFDWLFGKNRDDNLSIKLLNPMVIYGRCNDLELLNYWDIGEVVFSEEQKQELEEVKLTKNRDYNAVLYWMEKRILKSFNTIDELFLINESIYAKSNSSPENLYFEKRLIKYVDWLYSSEVEFSIHQNENELKIITPFFIRDKTEYDYDYDPSPYIEECTPKIQISTKLPENINLDALKLK